MTLEQQIKLWHLSTQTSFCHWWARGYHYVEVPSMVRASGACEFVDSLMEASLDSSLNWAAQPVFLKQTGQLHLEGLHCGTQLPRRAPQSVRRPSLHGVFAA